MKSYFSVLALAGIAFASDKHFTMFHKSKWFIAEDGPTIKSHTTSSVEIDYAHHHYENHGVLTYFDSVDIEEGVTYVTSGTWESKGRDSQGDCPSKYWTESKYDHACVVDGKIVDGCREYVECPRDTGDFRIVIADSNGSTKITKDGYESLDEISAKWNGFHIRVMPHVTKSFTRRSLIFPNTIWMKNKDEKDAGMFDHSSSRQQVVEMRDQADNGGFGLENGGKTTYEFRITKVSSRKFDFSMKLNGHTYKTVYDFPSSTLVPKKLDTFAVTMPNLRDYEYLKLHENSSMTAIEEVVQDISELADDIAKIVELVEEEDLNVDYDFSFSFDIHSNPDEVTFL